MRRLCIVLLLASCAASWAQAPAELNAEVKVLTAEQVAALRVKATAGDAAAQLRMGRVCELGQTTPQDYAAAREWYEKAADQGKAAAQYWLGGMYFSGRGTKRDAFAALTWWLKAANQGYAPAQRNVAQLDLRGDQGVPKDAESGLRWFRKAAASGDPEYQMELAEVLTRGGLLPHDYGEAQKWMNLAAEKSDVAQLTLGLWYENGSAGLTRDVPKAIEWLEKAAANGNSFGNAEIGIIHERGQGVPQDYAKAAHYYQLAADQGSAIGKFDLGWLYEDGKGVPYDPAKAVALYEASAVEVPTARNNLAELYEQGSKVARDPERAYMWALLHVSAEWERILKGEATPPDSRFGHALLRLQRVRKGLSGKQRDEQYAQAKAWLGAHRPALEREYEHFDEALGKEK